MRSTYLFPHKYKKFGWMLLIPSAIAGLVTLILEYEPPALDVMVWAIAAEGFLETRYFGMIENNILNEILGILVIASALLVAFSKEKEEDEFIAQIRLKSLVWATYFNYGLLLLAFLFFYEFSFFWFMVVNMFTILIFFIIRFNWKVGQLKRDSHEE